MRSFHISPGFKYSPTPQSCVFHCLETRSSPWPGQVDTVVLGGSDCMGNNLSSLLFVKRELSLSFGVEILLGSSCSVLLYSNTVTQVFVAPSPQAIVSAQRSSTCLPQQFEGQDACPPGSETRGLRFGREADLWFQKTTVTCWSPPSQNLKTLSPTSFLTCLC